MKANQSSATAYLVAESVVRIAKNKVLKSFVQPQAEELSSHFINLRPWSQRLILRAKQNPFLRPLFAAVENAVIPGLPLHHQLRKLRLEEITREAIAEDFRQIVIFGAGFDTLALRLRREFPNVNFVEIDYPATQTAKRKTIERLAVGGENLHFLALDLTEKIYSNALLEHFAFQKNSKTLFIAEGLLMYLSEADVRKLFRLVRSTCDENNRFAFTFMERENGRIGFRNSSKLVDYWLKRKGEPFLWGLRTDELEFFLEAEKFSLQSSDSAATFRRKYLQSPQFAKTSLAEGEFVCVANFKKENEIYVNDIHSKLNKTRVTEIIKPKSVAEIQAAVKKARNEGKHVSIGGGFHAMGGQQFLSDGVLLNLSAMNRILDFDTENGLIEVESGIHWNALVEYTVSAQAGAKHQFGIRQKQTGADNLSIGGAISANIHGRGLRMKPFIDDVESFKIVNENGEILDCSRRENAELFSLVIGGYGLFGVVVSVVLRLSKRRKLRRVVKIETIENLSRQIETSARENFYTAIFSLRSIPNRRIFSTKACFRVIKSWTTKRRPPKIVNSRLKTGNNF